MPTEPAAPHAIRLPAPPVDRDEDRDGMAERSRRRGMGGGLSPQPGEGSDRNPDSATVADLDRFLTALFPALAKLGSRHRDTRRRARMFNPPAVADSLNRPGAAQPLVARAARVLTSVARTSSRYPVRACSSCRTHRPGDRLANLDRLERRARPPVTLPVPRKPRRRALRALAERLHGHRT